MKYDQQLDNHVTNKFKIKNLNIVDKIDYSDTHTTCKLMHRVYI